MAQHHPGTPPKGSDARGQVGFDEANRRAEEKRNRREIAETSAAAPPKAPGSEMEEALGPVADTVKREAADRAGRSGKR